MEEEARGRWSALVSENEFDFCSFYLPRNDHIVFHPFPSDRVIDPKISKKDIRVHTARQNRRRKQKSKTYLPQRKSSLRFFFPSASPLYLSQLYLL